MNTLEDAKQKAATTYNAASDYFDHPANTFWERYGRRTVEHVKTNRNLFCNVTHPSHGLLFRALPLAKAFESC